jgi:ubiquinone biosynthesis protein
MLKKDLIPTPLIAASERPPVTLVVPRERSSRLVWRQLLGWVAGLVWLRLRGRSTPAERARRLRLVLERLGGLWIKVGQLLSLRTDIFSPELCRELADLQFQALGFPFPLARRIVEAELGAPLESCFDVFEEAPFAAASVAQIHRARLRQEGTWVAVKVQRPGIEAAFAADMAVVRRLVGICERLSIVPYFRWQDFVWELNQTLIEEVDYRFEAENLRRMKKTLRRHHIFVPKVFRRYSSRRLVVMELISAVLMSDVIRVAESDPGRLAAWFAENDIDPERVGERLYRSSFRQILEDNLFHSDLHPGNVTLLRHSRIALLDFGSVGTLEGEYRTKYYLFLQSLARGEYARAIDLLFLLNHALPDIDLGALKEDLIRSLRVWERRTMTRGLPYVEKSQTNLTIRMGQVMFDHKITPEWGFLRVTRATNTLDASLMYLMPDTNYSKLLIGYFRRAERRRVRAALSGSGIAGTLSHLLVTGGLPGRGGETELLTGTLLRREAQSYEGTTTKGSDLGAFALAVAAAVSLGAGLFLLAAFLLAGQPERAAALLGPALGGAVGQVPRLGGPAWALVLGAVGYLALRSIRLRRRFRKRDYRPRRSSP